MNFDFIVVGGGSAGCVLAARLSENPDATVLLLEAGPTDSNPYIHMPAGFFELFRRTHNPYAFNYATAPNASVHDRAMALRQGKVLGGGSSINAMVYTRGCADDYNRWAFEQGCDGWSFDDVLPAFRAIENNEMFADVYHGTEGPVGISNPISPNPLSKVFIQACQQAGLPYNPDFNGRTQAGCGLYQLTQRDGRRSSSARAFLGSAKGRKNLTIMTGAAAKRLVIRSGRAVGIVFDKDRREQVAMADREIVLSSGAIGSPKLLMLSGIGPAAHLDALSIAVEHDLPGVGQNFHDHLNVDMVYGLTGPFSLERYAKRYMKLLAGAEYLMFRRGPVTSNIAEAGAFWFADTASRQPDLQFHFMLGANIQPGMPAMTGRWGCTLDSYYSRPRSRGSVTLRSADPADPPLIDPAYLTEQHDVEMSVNGAEISREIMRKPAFSSYVSGEHYPADGARTRVQMEDFIRRFGRTAHHPAGSCKMGTDAMAVVDPRLRVHGIDGLRIADSSIMPSLVNSNTNFPCMMIGERASRMMLGNQTAESAARTLPQTEIPHADSSPLSAL
ncbi:MAG: GMC family oxidoreductase N-terminal domain-containing protein [Sphingomonadales bacterium]